MPYPFPQHIKSCSVMMFIDGENLSIRWKNQIGKQKIPSHVRYEPDVYVWSHLLNMETHVCCNITRKYYYASVGGGAEKEGEIVEKLKALGIESPNVFHRSKSKGSKRVDISLSVDMLAHAYQKNYDVAVLVAGDEDYVPLVSAVKNAGRRVFVWFPENGLSPSLKRSADYYFDISSILANPKADMYF